MHLVKTVDQFNDRFADRGRSGLRKKKSLSPKYNPDQPRDELGRWGNGGGGSSDQSAAALESWWSGGYEDINEAARNGRDHEAFAGLDAAIDGATPITSDATVYRGISAPANSHVAQNMAKGYTFSDDGYIAVTDEQNVAENFAVGGDLDNNSYVCRIHVPAGTKMADVPSGISERLLRRGSGRYFKVTGIKKRSRTNVWDVDLRYVDNK